MDNSIKNQFITLKAWKLLNYWWLLISIWGFVKMTIYANNPSLYPIGFSLLVLGLLTFNERKKRIKISYAFALSLIFIYGMEYAFQSTQTMFAFLVSTTLLILMVDDNYKTESIVLSLLAIPSLCDIYAGLNKLIPSSLFYNGEILNRVFSENLFLEPNFILSNVFFLSKVVPILEILCGLSIIIFPFKSIYFLILLHFPIAIFTGSHIGHLISLCIYALFLIFCVKSSVILMNEKDSSDRVMLPLNFIKKNIILFLKGPRNFLKKSVNPLFILGIFQFIVPTLLFLVRIFTGEVMGYGFGWQMFSA